MHRASCRLAEDKEGRMGKDRWPPPAAPQQGRPGSPAQWLPQVRVGAAPGFPGVVSSHGARPAGDRRPCPGPSTHPRGLLSRTFQQTPVDGRNLGLQLRRHLPSSSSPALTPLPPPQGPRPRHSPGDRYRLLCPRQSVRNRPGGGGWRRRESK